MRGPLAVRLSSWRQRNPDSSPGGYSLDLAPSQLLISPLCGHRVQSRLLHQTAGLRVLTAPGSHPCPPFPPSPHGLRCFPLGSLSQQIHCSLISIRHGGCTCITRCWPGPQVDPFPPSPLSLQDKDAARLPELNSSASGTPTCIFKFLCKQIGFLQHCFSMLLHNL